MAPGGCQNRKSGNADCQPDPLTGLARAYHHVTAEQAPGHQGDAQAKPQPHVAQQLAVVRLLLGLLSLIVALIGFAGAITGGLDGLYQGVETGVAADAGSAIRKVHVRLIDTGGVAQGAFNGAYAGRTGRPGNIENDVDSVAGLGRRVGGL